MPIYNVRRPLSAEEQSGLAAYPPLLARLLFHRGLKDAGAAASFLDPDYDAHTHDPYLLEDARKAADRIIHAVKTGEKIAIYADYDADGIPGAAMWSDFFGRIGFKNFVTYIPHRHDEGFGLNERAVEELSGQGARLLITVDCGIADAEPVKKAAILGLDVIITDHHEPPVSVGGAQSLPPAFAVVNPKRADCAYPDKQICGSAVAFKLIQAVLKKAKDKEKKRECRDGLIDWKDGAEKWFLDLVGLATLSDMVPLTGENRIFAYYGMQVLRKTPRKGLRRLFDKLRLSQRHLTEDDLTFMVTPRINAASRMGVPMDAFSLLVAGSDDDAARYAELLEAVNGERKSAVATLVKEVRKTVKDRHGSAMPPVIVLGNPIWRPSLLGLAANSCAEEFGRPVFLWGRDGDNAVKGSCRSEGRTHVVELMRAAPPGVFTQFGGHKHSGGFAVADDQIYFLEQRLNEAAKGLKRIEEKEGPAGNEKGLTAEAGGSAGDLIDAELSLDDVNSKLYDDVNRLAPFGTGNPKPVFLFRGVAPASVRRFGKGYEHMELKFKRKDGSAVPAVSFFGAGEPWAAAVGVGRLLDLVASVEKSYFRGMPELRLRIADVSVK